MKQLLKKILAAAIILTLVLSGTMTVFGANSGGIQVQYNGKNLTFSSEAKNVNGRVMLPFRELLESMGAEVSYDSKSKTITAKTADREISFTSGIPEVSITKDGAVTKKKMDVAPFIDKNLGHTFVPARIIAESLGDCVGWDPAEKAVVIIDPATLFSNADTDFSVVSELLNPGLDREKAYATTGKFDVSVATYASPEAIMPGFDFSMTGTMTGIQQKNNADLVMGMAFNFDKMLSTLPEEQKSLMEPLLSMFKNAEMKVKMNGETGETYMNSSLFSAIDPTVGKNTWYKMNVFDSYKQMGIDMKSLMGMSENDVKLSEVLTASLASDQYMDLSTYQYTKTMYLFMKNLIGDDSFAKKTVGSVTTYSLNLSQDSVLAALAKTALSEGIPENLLNVTDAGDMLNGMQLTSNITISEKAGALSGYTLKGSLGLEDANYTFDMRGDQKNTKGSMSFNQKDAFNMTMDIESHISESSKAPDLTLPADAVVVEYPVTPAAY